jgi:hypothetical protein
MPGKFKATQTLVMFFFKEESFSTNLLEISTILSAKRKTNLCFSNNHPMITFFIESRNGIRDESIVA